MHIQTLTREALVVDLNSTPPANRLSVLEVLEVHKEDPRWLPLLTGQESLVTVPISSRLMENGGGFARVTVTSDFLDPYLELLESRTGSRIAAVVLTPLLRWTHTYLMESCAYRDGAVHATMVIRVYPPTNVAHLNDDARQELATRRAVEHLQYALGAMQSVPEFIAAGDTGLFKRNPAYGRNPLPPQKGAVDEEIWQTLFQEWVQTVATADQRGVLQRLARYRGQHEVWPSLRDYHSFHLDQYRTAITWDDFNAGLVPPVAPEAA